MFRIVIVCPAPIKGSGGIRTILTYAKALSESGNDVVVSFLEDGEHLGGNISALVEHTYGISGLKAEVFPSGLEQADLVVATRWDTPRLIRHFYGGKLVHLIQDIEGWFNPVGDAYLAAENNFLLATHFITLGHWLAKKQQLDYGGASFTMDFGYDAETYHFEVPYDDRSNRVCFIYQPEKPRRCTQIGIEALGIVKAKRPDCEIVFYGNDIPAHLWYPVTNLGILHPDSLNQLYNSCRVGLCISASNPSRIPFEMTASGLPVVDIFRANNLHDYADGNGVLLAHQTPEALAKAILSILDNGQFSATMSREARAFAAGRSITQEVAQFVSYISKILRGETAPTRSDFGPLYRGKPIQSEAYSASRVKAFCDHQVQEFASATLAARDEDIRVSSHVNMRNVVPLAKMFSARPTCVLPKNLGWEPVSFPQGNILQTHPVKDTVVSVVIPQALPSAVKHLNATVRVANSRAATMEFAMAALPAQRDPDSTLLPDAAVWTGPRGSGWIKVSPGADHMLVLELEVATEGINDLHLAVRSTAGASVDFAWCQWMNFVYLQVEPEGF